jgi:hypothetical protein
VALHLVGAEQLGAQWNLCGDRALIGKMGQQGLSGAPQSRPHGLETMLQLNSPLGVFDQRRPQRIQVLYENVHKRIRAGPRIAGVSDQR